MSPFIPKKIGQENSLGEELRRARNNKKISIEKAAKILNIRKELIDTFNSNSKIKGLKIKNE